MSARRACSSRSASVCGPQAPIVRSSCVSWPRRARTRRWMPSRRRSPSMVALVSGSSTGSRPCSPTTRSCCCSTTASTSSSRSPASWRHCSPGARTCRCWRRAGSACGWAASGCARCRRSRRPPTMRRPLSCSSIGPAPWRPASIPKQLSCRSSPRSCVDSTAYRWRSSLRRPGCTPSTSPRWRPGSTDGSSCLSAGSRTSSRHGSLNAAVSWSYGLLDEALRRTFTDLSVFAGTFTAADAAAVCDVGRTVVPAALDQLVERSLVMRAPDRRYVMLETLRAFGAEQRATDGRADVARRAPRPSLRPVGRGRRAPAPGVGPPRNDPRDR